MGDFESEKIKKDFFFKSNQKKKTPKTTVQFCNRIKNIEVNLREIKFLEPMSDESGTESVRHHWNTSESCYLIHLPPFRDSGRKYWSPDIRRSVEFMPFSGPYQAKIAKKQSVALSFLLIHSSGCVCHLNSQAIMD
jgi:hypothetical protein